MNTTASEILIPRLKELCDKYIGISNDPDAYTAETPSSLQEAEEALEKACHVTFEKLGITPGSFSFLWGEEKGYTAYVLNFYEGTLIDANVYPVIHRWEVA